MAAESFQLRFRPQFGSVQHCVAHFLVTWMLPTEVLLELNDSFVHSALEGVAHPPWCTIGCQTLISVFVFSVGGPRRHLLLLYWTVILQAAKQVNSHIHTN